MNNFNPEAAAQSLYGSPSQEPVSSSASAANPAPSESAAPAPANAAEQGAALFGAEQSDPTRGAEGLHGALSAYAPTARDIESAATQRLGLTDEEAKASATEWAGTFHKYGVKSDDAAHLAEIGIAALANGVDDAKAHAWRNESRAVLTSEFGATAGQALEDAKRLVASDPTLAAWLDQTGLGNHPKVVATIARRARHLRNAGRLK
ncbi:hypothetical protein [Roseateles sp.]|uniref:hypothetical protein n=1 Tax=Roseateles sp. TaxID=1971397 RepID=UPI002E07518E|nr:hypothetical protein [Roseateles sp.]